MKSTQNQRFSILKNTLFQLIMCSGTALLLIAFMILRYEGFFAAVRTVLRTLRPLMLGGLFALVLYRPCVRFEQDLRVWNEKRRFPWSAHCIRRLSITAGVALALLTLTGIVCVLLPQLAESAAMLTDNLQFYAENLEALTSRFQLPSWMSWARADEMLESLRQQMPKMLQKACGYTAGFLGCVLDIGIGAVFSVYLLADRERLNRQFHIVAGKLVSQQMRDKMMHMAKLSADTFAQFLRSQLTEAVILGVMCFLGILVLRMPFPVLVSVIIGVTNIVPYVGPILGTVPCTLILLMAEPKKALWFVIYIIVLQQVESNFIYPRVVGRSVGLPPTWVLGAIVVGGGVMGAVGMAVAVPLAAVIYTVLFEEQ